MEIPSGLYSEAKRTGESLTLRSLELAQDTIFCVSLCIMELEEKFEVIKEIVGDKISERKSDTKIQNYLYIMYGPFENYTESIFFLCKKEKLNAASVILKMYRSTSVIGPSPV